MKGIRYKFKTAEQTVRSGIRENIEDIRRLKEGGGEIHESGTNSLFIRQKCVERTAVGCAVVAGAVQSNRSEKCHLFKKRVFIHDARMVHAPKNCHISTCVSE